MKKIILGLVFAIMLGVTPVLAQQNDRDWRQDRRWEQRDNRRWERTDVRWEQRYVRYGRTVYREVYRVMYRNGVVIRRVLVRRERVEDRRGFRFNIYLPF